MTMRMTETERNSSRGLDGAQGRLQRKNKHTIVCLSMSKVLVVVVIVISSKKKGKRHIMKAR